MSGAPTDPSELGPPCPEDLELAARVLEALAKLVENAGQLTDPDGELMALAEQHAPEIAGFVGLLGPAVLQMLPEPERFRRVVRMLREAPSDG